MDTEDVHTDPATYSTPETDVNMQDSKTVAPEAENGVPESGDKPAQMETDKKVSSQWLNFLCRLLPVSGRLAIEKLSPPLCILFRILLES